MFTECKIMIRPDMCKIVTFSSIIILPFIVFASGSPVLAKNMKIRLDKTTYSGNDACYDCRDGVLHYASSSCEDSFVGQEMLGRINTTSVTINLIPCRDDMSVYAEYGDQPGVYTHHTDTINSVIGEPLEIVINGLAASTRYYYRVLARQGSDSFLPREEGNFITRREEQESFVFAVTSDIHFYQIKNKEDQQNLLRKTMQNIKEDTPDFHIDLGDSFCTDYNIVSNAPGDIKSQEDGYQRYQQLREYLDETHDSIPFFFVLGNHEGELGFNFGVLAQWSENARLLYIPNPDNNTYPEGGSDKENYFAFTWGGALFIMLDPYRYTTVEPTGVGNSLNDWTLGSTQLQWLEQILQDSDAQYKFVFIHHLVGGCNTYGRGGAQCADRGEWGAIVHPLLVEHNVNAVFHGHDHAFIDETKDGVRYTLVPVPHRGETEWAFRFDFYDWLKIK